MHSAILLRHPYVRISELSVGWVDPRVGLGWVGNGSKICVFSGLGPVMGLKWQMCEKYMCIRMMMMT